MIIRVWNTLQKQSLIVLEWGVGIIMVLDIDMVCKMNKVKSESEVYMFGIRKALVPDRVSLILKLHTVLFVIVICVYMMAALFWQYIHYVSLNTIYNEQLAQQRKFVSMVTICYVQKIHDVIQLLFLCFLAFDFCRFCVVIRFFSIHNGQWPPTSKDFLSHILSITFIFLS